jgi:hypothetical protein
MRSLPVESREQLLLRGPYTQLPSLLTSLPRQFRHRHVVEVVIQRSEPFKRYEFR